MKVLVADDEETTVTYLSAGLRARGFEVETAVDAMQVVMKAVRTVPDAIVLDIKMPGGTGIVALRRIRASAKTEHVPVVAITATATAEVRAEALQLGAVDCLEKPVDVDRLTQLLREVIGAET